MKDIIDKKTKEAIRRLIKGDFLTYVSFSDNSGNSGGSSYIVGYGGSSPVVINHTIGNCLVRMIEQYEGNYQTDAIVYDDDESARHLRNINNETIYVLNDRLKEQLIKALKYSKGDTVEYDHNIYGKGKGVITDRMNPFEFSVRLDGVMNKSYEISTNIKGITRMVIVEKTIRNRRVEISKEQEEELDYFDYLDEDEYF